MGGPPEEGYPARTVTGVTRRIEARRTGPTHLFCCGDYQAALIAADVPRSAHSEGSLCIGYHLEFFIISMIKMFIEDSKKDSMGCYYDIDDFL